MSNQLSALSGTASFSALRSVGGALPPDLIAAVIAGGNLPGLSGDDYHLELGLNPREAANRAWTVLRGAWSSYREALAALPAGQATTGLTRERWLLVLMRELGFGRVPTTPAGGLTVDGRSFPVSHLADGRLPVHLLGWGTNLDRRTPGMAGAAEQAPQAMVQRLLNSSDEYLWALLSNGSTLRVLRDSTSLVGPSYVEFDLAAIFDSDLFSDFVALYLICHQSRFEATEAGAVSCWLERWREHAVETGARALGALRIGVHDAIEAIGSGFVAHPKNSTLRDDLGSGKLLPSDFLHGLLRLVYRALFCFVAEDRGLLLNPKAPAEARVRYDQWFSTARLRRIATRRAGDNHGDHWQSLRLVMGSLGNEEGCPTLGILGLGGIFEPGPIDLDPGLEISNRYLLTAVRHLCVTRPDANSPRRTVDYRNLGADELGGIYEGLLDYTPKYDPLTRSFSLVSLAGSDRKTTGSYYTPSSLVEKLLDTALDPLLDEAETNPEPVGALLSLTVCDPSVGSAHFVVAAGRRIARRIASIRANGAEPTVEQIHDAMYDVVSHCLYGVDVNPLAAELAKVSLWLEGMAAGRPLSLLDGHIKVGNSLLGTTPALLADGIPDDAFTLIEGDDKRIVSSLKKRNKAERSGARQIGEEAQVPFLPVDFATVAAQVEAYVPKNLADAHVAAKRLRELDTSAEVQRAGQLANAWCTAFVVPKVPGAPCLTQSELRSIVNGNGSPDVLQAVEAVSAKYRWFHWHMEFPTIFGIGGSDANPASGWSGGFDCVIGNPPWERVKLQQQEWFASRMPAIADASNAATRKRLIADLEEDHPQLREEYLSALRQAEGESHFMHNSGRYPLCGVGDINTYAVFAEVGRSLLKPEGRLGMIVPTGIATDHTTRAFFVAITDGRELVSLHDFYDRKVLFTGADVHSFCLLTLSGRARPVSGGADYVFFCRRVADLDDPERHFRLTPEEILLLSPNTRTCPVFHSRRDAEVALGIYRRVPVLVRKSNPESNPWNLRLARMFDMTNDAESFRSLEDLESDGFKLAGNLFRRGGEVYLPLYEGRMGHQFNHRFATQAGGETTSLGCDELMRPNQFVFPQYWIRKGLVEERLARSEHACKTALLGFRRIARSTDERTVIASILPYGAASYGWILSLGPDGHGMALLLACYNSFVLDFLMRSSLSQASIPQSTAEQLPVPTPSTFASAAPWDKQHTTGEWVLDRCLELIYTAWDLADFAAELGHKGPPFRWDEERRAVLRAELDACFCHMYGLNREEVGYIMATFPVVRERDEKRFGEYRTKHLTLEAYDVMAKAIEMGEPFASSLSPVPGEGPRHPAEGTTPVRGTVPANAASRATGCGHNPDLGGGTPDCQICAFNSRRTS